MLLSNVFSDMFDDMFPTTARQSNGLMSCDIKEYGDHYELDMELAGFR